MTQPETSAGDDSHSAPTERSGSARVYNISLLFAFVTNVFQLIAVSLLFRYSDFVNVSGGDEWHLGWIVGLASVGAIGFRLFQGSAIDRFGPGGIWLLSLAGEIVALLWHLRIDSVSGIEVYAARTLFATSLAGTFGSWLSFISLQAPSKRVAEVIGVVGSSGFVGMAIGPVIGDWLFRNAVVDRNTVNMMFLVAAAMASLAWLTAALAVLLARDHHAFADHRSRSTPWPRRGSLRLVWNRRPGMILVMGMLMGLAIGFPGTFLRPLAEQHGIASIRTFFVTYNIVAFISRLLFRRAPQVLGLKPTILIGFGFMAVSMLLYLPVKSASDFWMPAVAGGLAHSFLFPSVVASCTHRFPIQQRGLATHLILAMYDSGTLIGMPLVGLIVTRAREVGWPPYPAAIATLCGLIVITSVVYLVVDREP